MITLRIWSHRHYAKPPHIKVVQLWARTGRLPAVKVGRVWMVDAGARLAANEEEFVRG